MLEARSAVVIEPAAAANEGHHAQAQGSLSLSLSVSLVLANDENGSPETYLSTGSRHVALV